MECGSTPRERVVESTLAAVASGAVDVKSPAVFVVGEVVRLRARLKRAELKRAHLKRTGEVLCAG